MPVGAGGSGQAGARLIRGSARLLRPWVPRNGEDLVGSRSIRVPAQPAQVAERYGASASR